MQQYIIEFDRIGRNHAVPPLRTSVAPNGDERIVKEVLRYAGRFLASSGFDATVELPFGADDTGRVWIEGGRFGTGTIKMVEVAHA